MEVSAIKRMRELEYENVRRKQMFAGLSLENRTLEDIIAMGQYALRFKSALFLSWLM